MSHTCHWQGCPREVPPKMWGCKEHWFRLPHKLRQQIWATYVPGQEITKTPSKEYLVAATEVQRWIKENGDSSNTRGKQTAPLSDEQRKNVIEKLAQLRRLSSY